MTEANPNTTIPAEDVKRKWQPTNKRDGYGVKSCADLYRTFDGETYPQLCSFPSKVQITALRQAGIKCRKVGEELYVRSADQGKAFDIFAQVQS